MKAKLFFSFFYFSNCALDCDQAKNNEKLKYPKTLQNVYCEIFAKIELEDSPEFNDLSQESDFTRLAVRIQRTGDPYTLREANYPYSVNKFWRECNRIVIANGEVAKTNQYPSLPANFTGYGKFIDENGFVVEYTEQDNWYHCLNRTHMAEWMKFYTQFPYEPSKGLFGGPDETLLPSIPSTNPFRTDNEVGLVQIREDRNILKNIKNETEPTIYGTTLMALCFSKYESKGVSESFKKICRNEFAYRCDSDRLNTNGINLYFCDQVKSPDLLAFHRKTPVEQIKKALEEKQRFMEDSE